MLLIARALRVRARPTSRPQRAARARAPPQVGLAMVHLHALFHALSAAHTAAGAAEERLTLPDVQAFCASEFSAVPAALDAEFAAVALRPPPAGRGGRRSSCGGAGHRSPIVGEPVVDFARFMRVLYYVILPGGEWPLRPARAPDDAGMHRGCRRAGFARARAAAARSPSGLGRRILVRGCSRATAPPPPPGPPPPRARTLRPTEPATA